MAEIVRTRAVFYRRRKSKMDALVDAYQLGAVDTVTELSALETMADGDVVATLRYSTSHSYGDGSANRYRYASGDTTAVDGGFVLTSAAGRWHAVDKSRANLLQFGAVGDGSTDDTTAIQAAIDALTTNGTVYIPSQTFIHGTLTIKSNLTFIGDGDSSVMKVKASNTGQWGFNFPSGTSKVRFTNFKVDGNEANQPVDTYNSAIRTTNCDELTFDNLYITAGGERAIDIRGSRDIRITNCRFYQTGINNPVDAGGQNGGNAISCDLNGTTACENVFITNNYFEWFGDAAIGVPTTIRAQVNYNTIRCATDISETPMSTESGISLNGCVDSECVGNVIIKPKAAGINCNDILSGVNWPPRNVIISQNILVGGSGLQGTIQLSSSNTDPCLSFVVTENVLDMRDNTTNSAMAIGGDEHRDLMIRGNIFRVDSVTAAQAGILLSGAGPDEYTITGNRFTNFGRGIDIQANVGTVGNVSGNDFVNCTTCVNSQNNLGNHVVSANAVTVPLDESIDGVSRLSLAAATGTVTVTLTIENATRRSGWIILTQDNPARDITWVAGTGINAGIWLGTEPTWSSDTASFPRLIRWTFGDGTNILLEPTSQRSATF